MVAIFGSTQTQQTSLSNFVILSFLEIHAMVEEMNSKMYWSIWGQGGQHLCLRLADWSRKQTNYSLLGFIPCSSCREVKNGSANHRLWWRSLLIDQSETLNFYFFPKKSKICRLIWEARTAIFIHRSAWKLNLDLVESIEKNCFCRV